MPRKIAVIDCETDPFQKGRIPVPFLWGLFDGLEYKQFEHEHVGAMISYLKDKPWIVYAHNGGRFDYHFLREFIDPGELTIIAGRLARFKIGRCEFRDSWNIIPAPLSAYKKDDFDYRIMEREVRYKTDNWRLIETYLRHDCEYLHEMVTKFVEKFGMNLTQAGASMKQWKKISGEYVEDSGAEFFEAFQPFYYGGRVECFQSGVIDKKFKVLDINSAYPYAMKADHPKGLDYAERNGFVPGAHFYRLTAKSTGAFPYRHEGKLSFPADGEIREFFVTGWEYAAARDTDALLSCTVRTSYTFAGTRNFSEYIDHFYTERLKAKAENDAAGDLFAKLFMNSLYGKFAANPAKYETVELIDPIGTKDDLGELYEDFEFRAEFDRRWVISKPLDPSDRRYYNVATAASITGYVRAMLWRAVHDCTRAAVLYCDTDSIATERVGAAVVLGPALGQWKDEGDYTQAAIAGKKLYAFKRTKPEPKAKFPWYKLASKGSRLTPEEVLRVAKGEKVRYVPEVPTFTILKQPHFVERDIINTS